jgi:ankyrin repeat protein
MELEEILKRQDVKALKEAINSGLDISKVKSIDFIFEVEEIDFIFLQILIDNGVNINEKDEAGYLLFDCIFDGSEEEKTIIRDESFMKYFIEFTIKNNNIEKDFFEEILMELIALGELEAIKTIVDYGADSNMSNEDMPLIFMLLFVDIQKNRNKIFQLFIDNGADINILVKGMPILLFASLFADLELIELLLKNGANPNVKIKGESLLGIILIMSRKLFELVNFNQTNEQDILAHFSNFEKSKYDIAKLLVMYGVDVNNEKINNIPLLQALSMDKNILKKYLEFGSSSEQESLLIFINSMNFGDIEIAKFLIECGADANIQDDNGDVPLGFACVSGNYKMVQLLCENGANVNIRDSNGDTYLMNACRENNIELVKVLLNGKVHIDALSENELGRTALIMACRKENVEIVKLLINAGADVNINIKGYDKVNAYSYGHNNKEIKKLLVKSGIKIDVLKFSSKREETKELRKSLEEKRSFNFKKIVINNKTPMTKILESKDTEALKILLNKGYDTEYVDIISLIKEDYPFEFIELIVAECIDINIQDKNGNTALMVASEMNNLDIVNMLLKYHVDSNLKNKNDEEAWELSDNQEIINRLLNFEDEIVLNHQPQNLVNLLTNFTIDTPIKYTTHSWDFGIRINSTKILNKIININ